MSKVINISKARSSENWITKAAQKRIAERERIQTLLAAPPIPRTSDTLTNRILRQLLHNPATFGDLMREMGVSVKDAYTRARMLTQLKKLSASGIVAPPSRSRPWYQLISNSHKAETPLL